MFNSLILASSPNPRARTKLPSLVHEQNEIYKAKHFTAAKNTHLRFIRGKSRGTPTFERSFELMAGFGSGLVQGSAKIEEIRQDFLRNAYEDDQFAGLLWPLNAELGPSDYKCHLVKNTLFSQSERGYG